MTVDRLGRERLGEPVALIASKRLTANGQKVAPGELFTVDDAGRALQLVEHGYAVAAPDGAEAVQMRHEIEASERGRRHHRPPMPKLPEKAARQVVEGEGPPPRLSDTLVSAFAPVPYQRDVMALLGERIETLEATVARLEAALGAQQAEPAPAPRTKLTRKASDT